MREMKILFSQMKKAYLDKYLGVDITHIDHTTFGMTQPVLMERILSLLGLKEGRTNQKCTPVGKPLLNKDFNDVERKYKWNYRPVIGIFIDLLDWKC